MGVTQIEDRLCSSDQERIFVEALVTHLLHDRRHHPAHSRQGLTAVTNGQLREIASRRLPGCSWSPQQLERLKCKYITRESMGRPATRFELLREVRKGDRVRGQRVGLPSRYEPTGILLLLGKGVAIEEASPQSEHAA
jgi:hypothetical protein